MARRKPAGTTGLPPSAPPPRPAYPEPSWYRDRVERGHPHMRTVRDVCADHVWHLPPFQREIVWDADRQVAYCNSILDGMPTAAILVWERYLSDPDPKRVSVVLDGQQRLTALGASVIRADGRPNPPSGAYFDLVSGRFTTDPGRWSLTATKVADIDLAEQIRIEISLENDEARLWYWRVYANNLISSAQMLFHVLPSSMPVPQVVEAFRTINRPGVQFDEAEVERLVLATAGWP